MWGKVGKDGGSGETLGGTGEKWGKAAKGVGSWRISRKVGNVGGNWEMWGVWKRRKMDHCCERHYCRMRPHDSLG